MILANYSVEKMASLRHARRWRRRHIALGVDENVAVFGLGNVESAGHQHFKPIEPPRLPVLVLKAEHHFAPWDTLHVRAQRFPQVVLDLAQHLERLSHLYRVFIEAKVASQCRDAANVDPGHGACAKVHRNPVRLPMIHSIEKPLARCAGCFYRGHISPFHRWAGGSFSTLYSQRHGSGTLREPISRLVPETAEFYPASK